MFHLDFCPVVHLFSYLAFTVRIRFLPFHLFNWLHLLKVNLRSSSSLSQFHLICPNFRILRLTSTTFPPPLLFSSSSSLEEWDGKRKRERKRDFLLLLRCMFCSSHVFVSFIIANTPYLSSRTDEKAITSERAFSKLLWLLFLPSDKGRHRSEIYLN